MFEKRVPQAKERARDESLADLATRYFATRGPATAHDFAWWSGLTLGDARRGIDAVASKFVKRELDGATYWYDESVEPAKPNKNGVHLLSAFDEYFIGLRDRSAWALEAGANATELAYASISSWPVVVDGQYVGLWTRKSGARAITLALDLLVDLSRAQQAALKVQAERYSAFAGAPVLWS